MIPVQPLLEPLARALAAARRGSKEKGVHQLRVVTRRIDVWLRLAGLHVLRDDLRWLRAAAGPVRDLDVLLTDPTFIDVRADAACVARLKAERKFARAHLRDVLLQPRTEACRRALALLPPASLRRATRRTARILHGLQRTHVDPISTEGVHLRRRGLRRLRYALDLLGHPVAELAELQDALGRVSDLTLAGRLCVPPVSPGVAHAPELAAALDHAASAWHAHASTLEDVERWISSCSDTQPVPG